MAVEKSGEAVELMGDDADEELYRMVRADSAAAGASFDQRVGGKWDTLWTLMKHLETIENGNHDTARLEALRKREAAIQGKLNGSPVQTSSPAAECVMGYGMDDGWAYDIAYSPNGSITGYIERMKPSQADGVFEWGNGDEAHRRRGD
jgi:hypothetical protein